MSDDAKTVEPGDGLLEGIANGIATDRFFTEERELLGLQAYAPARPLTFIGRCPACDVFGASATMTDDGPEYVCPAGCGTGAVRSAIERRLAASRAADLLAAAGEDMFTVHHLREIAASPTRRRV